MKKKRDVVININPFHAELQNVNGNSFEIWFFDKVGDDYSRKKIVKIHFQSYWLRFLAEKLWKVQRETQRQANEQAKWLLGDHIKKES